MGTRSLTKVIEDGQIIVNMYRQFDGYPSGHGQELFNFLNGITLVNGMSGDEKRKIANGAGCLSAQIVAHFKKEPGGFYLYPASETNCGQDYEYLVDVTNAKTPQVTVISGDAEMFKGTVAAFGVFCATEEE